MPAAHERSLDRYPVSLQLCYKATSNRGLVQGLGQTRMMGIKGIVFAPSHGLQPGMNAEIVVGWPSFRDDYQLNLVLQVTITGTQEGEAEASILSYYFRTAGTAEALRFDPAGMKNKSPAPEATLHNDNNVSSILGRSAHLLPDLPA